MSHRKRKVEIAPEVEKAVRRLHREYPELGHDGIGKLLEDEGLDIDSRELRAFMEEHDLNAGPTSSWRPKSRIPFIGGGGGEIL